MVRYSSTIGAVLLVFGVIDVIARIFPNSGGSLAICGAVIFASDIVARAIAGQKAA